MQRHRDITSMQNRGIIFLLVLPTLATQSWASTPTKGELQHSLREQRKIYSSCIAQIKQTFAFGQTMEPQQYEWAFKEDKLYQKGRWVSKNTAADYTDVFDGTQEQHISYPNGYPHLQNIQSMIGKGFTVNKDLNPLAVVYQYKNTWLDEDLNDASAIRPGSNDPRFGALIDVVFPHHGFNVTVSFAKAKQGWIGVKADWVTHVHDKDWDEVSSVDRFTEVNGLLLPEYITDTVSDVTPGKPSPSMTKAIQIKYESINDAPDSLFKLIKPPVGSVEVDQSTMKPAWVTPNDGRKPVDPNQRFVPSDAKAGWMIVGGTGVLAMCVAAVVARVAMTKKG